LMAVLGPRRQSREHFSGACECPRTHGGHKHHRERD
jgi:hypothetical protein